MRLVVCALACVGAGGMSLALADPPANPAPPTTATAPTAAQPAASAAAPAAKAPTSTVDVDAQREQDNLEKHFLAEGYKLEMHNGERLFCRKEEELGSRLGGHKSCGTAQQLQATERESQAAYQRGQTQQNNPSGK
jgi:curli biogenesis system outer membrane secretion channel CsgG